MSGLEPRGSEVDSAEPRFLVIGQVLKPHGVRGEFRVLPHTDDIARFETVTRVFIGASEAEAASVEVESTRPHGQVVLMKLAGVLTREDAGRYRGQLLYVPESEAVPLAEGEYFLFQLEGLAVYEAPDNFLGTLVEVLQTKANNVFVVRGSEGDLLLPDISEVIEDIDFSNRRMTVRLLPGLRG